MTKQYKKVADSSDALMIKEAIEKLSGVTLASDIGDRVGELVNELREARIQREGEIEKMVEGMSTPPPPPLDVQGLVENLYKLTNKPEPKPTYSFKIERNSSGALVGITATPSGGNE